MKKFLTIFIALLLCIGLSSCKKHDEQMHKKAKQIRNFVDYYASHVSEDYYETHDLDYKFLYKIKYDEATVKDRNSGKIYYFITQAWTDGTRASLSLFTDDEDAITGAEVYLNKAAMPLFKDIDELAQYYRVIAKGMIGQSADTYIDDLFSKIAYDDYASVDTSNDWSLSMEIKDDDVTLRINNIGYKK